MSFVCTLLWVMTIVCRDAESTGSHWQGPACRYAAAMFAASLIDGFESPLQENRVFC